MNLSWELITLIVSIVVAAIGATWRITQIISDYRTQNERDHGDLKKRIATVDGKLSLVLEKWGPRPERSGVMSAEELARK